MFEAGVLAVLLVAAFVAWNSGLTEDDYYSTKDYEKEQKMREAQGIVSLHKHICASSVIADRDMPVLRQAMKELYENDLANMVYIYPEKKFWIPFAFAEGEHYILCVPTYLLESTQEAVMDYARKVAHNPVMG